MFEREKVPYVDRITEIEKVIFDACAAGEG